MPGGAQYPRDGSTVVAWSWAVLRAACTNLHTNFIILIRGGPSTQPAPCVPRGLCSALSVAREGYPLLSIACACVRCCLACVRSHHCHSSLCCVVLCVVLCVRSLTLDLSVSCSFATLSCALRCVRVCTAWCVLLSSLSCSSPLSLCVAGAHVGACLFRTSCLFSTHSLSLCLALAFIRACILRAPLSLYALSSVLASSALTLYLFLSVPILVSLCTCFYTPGSLYLSGSS